jgi:hypothetical protein
MVPGDGINPSSHSFLTCRRPITQGLGFISGPFFLPALIHASHSLACGAVGSTGIPTLAAEVTVW